MSGAGITFEEVTPEELGVKRDGFGSIKHDPDNSWSQEGNNPCQMGDACVGGDNGFPKCLGINLEGNCDERAVWVDVWRASIQDLTLLVCEDCTVALDEAEKLIKILLYESIMRDTESRAQRLREQTEG